MYVSSVSLYGEPSPFWNDSVKGPGTGEEDGVQITACTASSDPVLSPTTCPASLIAWATADESPGSVPRSTIVNPGGEDEGGMNCTVRVGGFADSLDSYAIPSEEAVARRIPSFGSPSTHAWTNGMTLMAYSPTLVGEGAVIPDFVAGEPAGLKPFHVAPASLQGSVTWETPCVVPLFVIMSSRFAFTIVDPGGTCPGLGPMEWGNLIRVLHTVAGEIRHPDPSTSSCGFAPKFVSGAPLAMYVSSVSLNGPPSPWRKVTGATEAVRLKSSGESMALAESRENIVGTKAPIAATRTSAARQAAQLQDLWTVETWWQATRDPPKGTGIAFPR